MFFAEINTWFITICKSPPKTRLRPLKSDIYSETNLCRKGISHEEQNKAQCETYREVCRHEHELSVSRHTEVFAHESGESGESAAQPRCEKQPEFRRKVSRAFEKPCKKSQNKASENVYG